MHIITVCNPDGTENNSPTFLGNINPIRYRSYYFDTETGLYYLQTRYYDPQIGRFLNADDLSYLLWRGRHWGSIQLLTVVSLTCCEGIFLKNGGKFLESIYTALK